MMTRVQVSLPSELQRRARARAGELGISFAEYVRRLVAGDLGTPKPAADISAIFGLGHSGGSDVASFKDEYVGEAVDAEHPREAG